MTKYKIVRFYMNPDKESKVLKRGLTEEEAQAYCKDPNTSSRTATNRCARAHTARHGEWFDGYAEDRG